MWWLKCLAPVSALHRRAETKFPALLSISTQKNLRFALIPTSGKPSLRYQTSIKDVSQTKLDSEPKPVSPVHSIRRSVALQPSTMTRHIEIRSILTLTVLGMHKFRHLSSWKHLEVKLVRGSRIRALTTEALGLFGRILQDLRVTSFIGSPNVADGRHKAGACSSQRCVSQRVRECVRHLWPDTCKRPSHQAPTWQADVIYKHFF
jgi:hypothetical protein